MNKSKVITIIGGGAAGMMAAISAKAHNPNLVVELFEKNEKLGKKLLVCGAGRCNVTNSNITSERYYGSNKEFIEGVLDQFDNQKIVDFFEDLGVNLYEEEKNGIKKGKMFPITNQASTVNDLLISELERVGVIIKTNREIVSVDKSGDKFVIKTTKNATESDYLVLACGGLTYPILGGTDIGYKFAKKLGHSIIKPVPSALPLEVDEWILPRLAGQRVTVEITSIIGDKEVKKDTDEMMFAKYGLTGPVILNISREISVRLNRDDKQDCYLKINFVPGKNQSEIAEMLIARWSNKSDQTVLHSLYGILSNKISKMVLKYLRVDLEKLNSQLSEEEKNKIIEFLAGWKVKVKATRGWDQGEFTAGGVDENEIKSETLESKIVSGLFFAGEIVNVDGDVGGFNLSWAWSSGWVVGRLRGS